MCLFRNLYSLRTLLSHEGVRALDWVRARRPNFYEEFHGHPLTESSANRRVEIIFADVQGKEENLRESARYRPACFVSDGSHRREM